MLMSTSLTTYINNTKKTVHLWNMDGKNSLKDLILEVANQTMAQVGLAMILSKKSMY